MDPVAGVLAVGIGITGASITRALMAAANQGGNALETPSLTQLGVTAVCIVIGYFMLRRSDGRDRDAQAAEDKATALTIATLQAELKAANDRADRAEKRAEAAESRAEKAQARLLAVFTSQPTEQA